MLKRKARRWQLLTLDEVRAMGAELNTETIWHDALTGPMLVTSDRLAGRTMRFIYEDGPNWDYEFLDERHLRWKADDGRAGEEVYNASSAPGYENIIFVHHVCSLDVFGCVDLIMDLDSGCTILFDASLGHPDSPREVMRTIRFGTIEGVTPVPGAEKPCWTDDLTGKAIRWRTAKGVGHGIKYIFTSCNYLTYVMKFRGEDTCWVGTNPCDYIRLRDDLYICSTIEERQTGVELVMLMNLSMLTDVQTTFGIGGTIEQGIRLETTMHSGRVGNWEPMATDLFSE